MEDFGNVQCQREEGLHVPGRTNGTAYKVNNLMVLTPCCLPGMVCFPRPVICNQIPLAFKVRAFKDWRFLIPLPDPQVGNLLWALELLQKCESFFGIIVLQFVGCLWLCGAVLFNRLSGKWSSADQATDKCLTSG